MNQMISTLREYQSFDGELAYYHVFGFLPLKNSEYWPFYYERLSKVSRNPRPDLLNKNLLTLIPAGCGPFPVEVETYFNHLENNETVNIINFLDLGGFLVVTDDYYLGNGVGIHEFYIDTTSVAAKLIDELKPKFSIEPFIREFRQKRDNDLTIYAWVIFDDEVEAFGKVEDFNEQILKLEKPITPNEYTTLGVGSIIDIKLFTDT